MNGKLEEWADAGFMEYSVGNNRITFRYPVVLKQGLLHDANLEEDLDIMRRMYICEPETPNKAESIGECLVAEALV